MYYGNTAVTSLKYQARDEKRDKTCIYIAHSQQKTEVGGRTSCLFSLKIALSVYLITSVANDCHVMSIKYITMSHN